MCVSSIFIGFDFRKVGSRKFFCVDLAELAEPSTKKEKKRSHEVDEGSSEVEPVSKRSCDDNMLNKLQEIQAQIQSVLEVKGSTKLPIGLLISLKDTFKCNLCLSTIKPPLITTRCCKSILGCDSCVTKLYSGIGGSSKACPLCRADRGFTETMCLKGMDDFLKTIYSLVEDSDEGSDDEYTFRFP